MNDLLQELKLKESYQCKCIECGLIKGKEISPSIAMEMGVNVGVFGCPECNKINRCRIDKTNTFIEGFEMIYLGKVMGVYAMIYRIAYNKNGEKYIECGSCKRKSYSSEDIENKRCESCEKFHRSDAESDCYQC